MDGLPTPLESRFVRGYVRNDLGKGSRLESAVVVFLHNMAYGKQLNGARINARQRRSGQQVRGSPGRT
jgi:hypothetical protein